MMNIASHRRQWLSLGSAVLLAAALVSCQTAPPAAAPPAPADPTAGPAPRPVSARMAGTVAEIHAAPGTRVPHGAWIATLAPPRAQTGIPALRQALRDRESVVTTAREAFLEAKQQVETGEGTSEGLPALQAELDDAVAARNAAIRDLENAQQALEVLRHYTPCAGIVTEPLAEIGQTVAAGDPILFIQPQP